jgi:site-specific DNA-cytosine methylase
MIFEEKINIFDKSNRVYDQNGISPTLTSTSCDEKILINSLIRRLTPIECERLQTVKDNYTAHVSDSQRYKMLGNGWTVDVIAHIFSYLTF